MIYLKNTLSMPGCSREHHIAHNVYSTMVEKPVSRNEAWQAINGSLRPQQRTSAIRHRSRESVTRRVDRAKQELGPEGARVEKGHVSDARCLFRRNMGLFPFHPTVAISLCRESSNQQSAPFSGSPRHTMHL